MNETGGPVSSEGPDSKVDWTDAEPLQTAFADPDTAAAPRVVAPDLSGRPGSPPGGEPVVLPAERFPTLGRWGPSA
jgi:hypothetical protein